MKTGNKQITFGEWLAQCRSEARMSQQALADRTKGAVSKAYISKLERHQKHTVTDAAPQPSREIVKALAIALNRPVDEALSVANWKPEKAEEQPRSVRVAALGLKINRLTDTAHIELSEELVHAIEMKVDEMLRKEQQKQS